MKWISAKNLSHSSRFATGERLFCGRIMVGSVHNSLKRNTLDAKLMLPYFENNHKMFYDTEFEKAKKWVEERVTAWFKATQEE